MNGNIGRTWRGPFSVAFAMALAAAACAPVPPDPGDTTSTTTASSTTTTTSTTTTSTTTTTTSTTTTTTTPPSGGSGPPVNGVAPSVGGTLRVGSTLEVNTGTWTGASPITYSYRYQLCSASGIGCSQAPGLFATGPRPRLLLTAGTAGGYLRVRVTATNPEGAKTVNTAVVGPIGAYPASSAPLVELVNGVPDDQTSSDATIFQFQETGTAVTVTCQLDSAPAATCPTNRKPSYSGLGVGSHTFTVRASNVHGTATASHTWAVVPSPAPTPCPGCYHPAVGETWQWQLNPDVDGGSIDTTVVADMYDIDGFVNDASVVSTLKSLPGTSVASRGVTCYWAAGTLENWRPDAPTFDPMLLGNTYFGFEDERWLDIRRISDLAPALEARMDMCASKGFDAIEFDNMDSWYSDNGTGLNITESDAVAFVQYLARESHERGLSMALKSVVEIVPAVRDHVDFSVVEECFQNQECTRASPNTGGLYGYDMMIEIGKPVFATEYLAYNPLDNVCAESNLLGFSTIYKRVDLDSYRVSCN